jgi:pimeloyl-ACP methyl ester carboxylesterase
MPYVKINEADLYYEVAGAGPPVLLIQGAAAIGGAWRPQVDNLREAFTCVTFDNRGIGQSTAGPQALTIEQMAQDALALCDELGLESHIVGHSMGGLIAQELALAAPRRVRSLALLCTFARGREAARISPRTVCMGIGTDIGSRASRRRNFLKILFSRNYLQATDEIGLAERTGTLLGRDLAGSPPILRQQLAAMRRFDRTADLANIDAPAMVVSAQYDPIALPGFGRHLAQQIAGARYVEIPGTSHGVTIQLPETVNDILQLHFDRVEQTLRHAEQATKRNSQ